MMFRVLRGKRSPWISKRDGDRRKYVQKLMLWLCMHTARELPLDMQAGGDASRPRDMVGRAETSRLYSLIPETLIGISCSYASIRSVATTMEAMTVLVYSSIK